MCLYVCAHKCGCPQGQKRAPDPLRRVSPQGAGNWTYILYKLNLSPCTISPAPRWRFLQLGWSQVFLFFNDIDYEFFGHCGLKPIELFPIGPNVIYWLHLSEFLCLLQRPGFYYVHLRPREGFKTCPSASVHTPFSSWHLKHPGWASHSTWWQGVASLAFLALCIDSCSEFCSKDGRKVQVRRPHTRRYCLHWQVESRGNPQLNRENSILTLVQASQQWFSPGYMARHQGSYRSDLRLVTLPLGLFPTSVCISTERCTHRPDFLMVTME